MNNAKWKILRQDFTLKQILDGFFGGFIFATLLYAPIVIILVEMLTVYMYLLTLFVILIIISLFVYIAAIHYFWWKSLILKKAEEAVTLDDATQEMRETGILTCDIRKLFIRNSLVINTIILILGLVFIFVFIPILWI